ncbi:MAG TPA: four helix bundle protein [Chitinophagaceae bacterium]|nr:four helix bundle protein [Chitinophagaceae bacterium]
MEYQFNFEKLDVWQDSRKLAADIYLVTREFPADEKYAIIQQIRRAVVSVASNLAEGSTRTSPKEQAHFTTISFGSLMELLNQLIISSDLGYLKTERLTDFRNKIQSLSVRLSNLKKSQVSKIKGLKVIVWMILAPQLFQTLQPVTL